MSKLNTSSAAYADVKRAFEIAIARGSVLVEFDTTGKAVNFKLRANRFRNLERERLAELSADVPGYRAETSYDIFEIVFAPPLNEKRTSNRVLFRQRDAGRFLDPETGAEV